MRNASTQFARFFVFMMTFFMVSMTPLLALAEKAVAKAAPQQAWWQALLVFVIEFALAVGVPVIVILITLLLRRWGINVEQDQVKNIAEQAADFAEKKAKAALKADGKKTPGAEKMLLALNFAKDLADQYKLSEKATKKMQGMIEAAVERKDKKEAEAPKPAQPEAKPQAPPSEGQS